MTDALRLSGEYRSSHLQANYQLGSNKEAALVILVHGKAGNRQVMSIFEKAFPEGVNYLYPEADLPDPLGGYSWWLENTAENYQLAASKLDELLSSFIESFELKPQRVIACGFSQGGACLSWLSQERQGLFAQLALICSFYLPHPEVASIYPNTFVYHGLQDQVVTIGRAMEGVNYLVQHQAAVNLVTDLQGHKISARGMKYLKEWVAREVIGN